MSKPRTGSVMGTGPGIIAKRLKLYVEFVDIKNTFAVQTKDAKDRDYNFYVVDEKFNVYMKSDNLHFNASDSNGQTIALNTYIETEVDEERKVSICLHVQGKKKFGQVEKPQWIYDLDFKNLVDKNRNLKESTVTDIIYFNGHKGQGGTCTMKIATWSGIMTYEEVTEHAQKLRIERQKMREQNRPDPMEALRKLKEELHKVEQEYNVQMVSNEHIVEKERLKRESECDRMIVDVEKSKVDKQALINEEKQLAQEISKQENLKNTVDVELSEKYREVEKRRMGVKESLEKLKQRNAIEFLTKKLEATLTETNKQLRNTEDLREETKRKIKDLEEEIRQSQLRLKTLSEKSITLAADVEKTRKQTQHDISEKSIEIQAKINELLTKDKQVQDSTLQYKQEIIEARVKQSVLKKQEDVLIQQIKDKEYEVADVKRRYLELIKEKKAKEEELTQSQYIVKEKEIEVVKAAKTLDHEQRKANKVLDDKAQINNMIRTMNGETRKISIESTKLKNKKEALRKDYEGLLVQYNELTTNYLSKLSESEKSAMQEYIALEQEIITQRLLINKKKSEKESVDKRMTKMRNEMKEIQNSLTKCINEISSLANAEVANQKRVNELENQLAQLELAENTNSQKLITLTAEKSELEEQFIKSNENIEFLEKLLEDQEVKLKELRGRDTKDLENREEEFKKQLKEISEKLAAKERSSAALEVDLNDIHRSLESQNKNLRDLKQSEAALEKQRIEDSKSNNPQLRPMKSIDITQDMIQGKMMIEPIVALKESISNLLKMISNQTKGSKDLGFSLMDFLQSPDILQLIGQQILPSILGVLKYGIETNFWFTYGHFWTFVSDLVYYSPHPNRVSELKELVTLAQRDVDAMYVRMGKLALYDAYTKCFIVHCFNLYGKISVEKKKNASNILTVLDVILNNAGEHLHVYYAKHAILRNDLEMDKFRKILMVLIKLPFNLEPNFFLQ